MTVPLAIFGALAALMIAYFGVSLAFPNWLADLPTAEAWFRYVLAAITMGLFLLAEWRYYQSFLLARLHSQLGMVLGLVLLAEAQLSLTLGEPWHWSWWEYHALFLVAFLVVLAGWAWEGIRAGSIEAIAEALLMRDAMAQLNRGRHESLVQLADKIEAHDIATFGHVRRVAAHALLIGKELGLSPQALRRLVLAAQMHDIGKIGLPLGLLNKPGKLTAEEFEQMKTHALKGWEISQRVQALRDMAHIIRHHHEHFDGRGYPDGLKGEEIPLDYRRGRYLRRHHLGSAVPAGDGRRGGGGRDQEGSGMATGPPLRAGAAEGTAAHQGGSAVWRSRRL